MIKHELLKGRFKQVVESAFESLLSENVGTSEKPVQVINSDISLLLYQKSVSDIDEVALKEWLSSVTSHRSEPLPFSDDQMFAIIKSRYIQSHQDIATYCKETEAQFDDLISEYQDYLSQSDAPVQSSVSENPTSLSE